MNWLISVLWQTRLYFSVWCLAGCLLIYSSDRTFSAHFPHFKDKNSSEVWITCNTRLTVISLPWQLISSAARLWKVTEIFLTSANKWTCSTCNAARHGLYTTSSWLNLFSHAIFSILDFMGTQMFSSWMNFCLVRFLLSHNTDVILKELSSLHRSSQLSSCHFHSLFWL